METSNPSLQLLRETVIALRDLAPKSARSDAFENAKNIEDDIAEIVAQRDAAVARAEKAEARVAELEAAIADHAIEIEIAGALGYATLRWQRMAAKDGEYQALRYTLGEGLGGSDMKAGRRVARLLAEAKWHTDYGLVTGREMASAESLGLKREEMEDLAMNLKAYWRFLDARCRAVDAAFSVHPETGERADAQGEGAK
jgi:hypothetical protein